MANSRGSRSEAIRVADRIRDDILDGFRLPGDRLVERTIAEELGVSRVPVREALKALVAEGLVTLRPRTWAIVREFSVGDIVSAAGNEFALHAELNWVPRNLAVKVPDGVEVRSQVVGVFGGTDVKVAPPRSGAPVVILKGIAMFGGIEVRNPKDKAKRRHRD